PPGDDDLPEPDHVLPPHRLPDDRKRILSDPVFGRQVVRAVEITLVDFRTGHEFIEVDNFRAFQPKAIELLVLDRHVFVLANLIAAPLVHALDDLASDGVNELLLETVPGFLADLPEAHPLAG